MRGRPRKPTALKLIAGTAHKNSATSNAREPESPLLSFDQLEPPGHLHERSKAVWSEVAPVIARMGLLAEADRISLEMLCDAVADYRHARERRGDNFTASTIKGGTMLNQWLVVQQMSGKRAEGLMSRFGMDPAARTRLMVPDQPDLFDSPPPTSRFFSPPTR